MRDGGYYWAITISKYTQVSLLKQVLILSLPLFSTRCLFCNIITPPKKLLSLHNILILVWATAKHSAVFPSLKKSTPFPWGFKTCSSTCKKSSITNRKVYSRAHRRRGRLWIPTSPEPSAQWTRESRWLCSSRIWTIWSVMWIRNPYRKTNSKKTATSSRRWSGRAPSAVPGSPTNSKSTPTSYSSP